jgi:hypothetical protein
MQAYLNQHWGPCETEEAVRIEMGALPHSIGIDMPAHGETEARP